MSFFQRVFIVPLARPASFRRCNGRADDASAFAIAAAETFLTLRRTLPFCCAAAGVFGPVEYIQLTISASPAASPLSTLAEIPDKVSFWRFTLKRVSKLSAAIAISRSRQSTLLSWNAPCELNCEADHD